MSRIAWLHALLMPGLLAACGMDPLAELDCERPDSSALGPWVLHIAGDQFHDHVQLVRVYQAGADCRSLRWQVYRTRDWSGAVISDLARFRAAGAPQAGTYQWLLYEGDRPSARLAYAVFGDTLAGHFEWLGDRATGYPVRGARADPDLLQLDDPPPHTASADQTPTVLLRLDDAPSTDRDFVERLKQRGLYAEIGVVARRPGSPGNLDWKQLQDLREHGFTIVAHSVTHQRRTGPGADFMLEVLGSLQAVKEHGGDPDIFVQPGLWKDSISFDAPWKVETWRGSLLRTFTRVLEAYVTSPRVALPVRPDQRLGLSHVTASDGRPSGAVMEEWQRAQTPGVLTVFLVHTRGLKRPDQLDWFLDSLAAARNAGRIRLLHSAKEAW